MLVSPHGSERHLEEGSSPEEVADRQPAEDPCRQSDRRLAGILASDLIINAVTNGAGETLMLAVRCSATQFRVEIHDASVHGDSWETTKSDADAERGLLLAAALAAESGHYRTPAGRAVYYTLEFAPGSAETGDGHVAQGAASGDGEP